MDSAANIVVLAGLVIGLAYGAIGLLSGFCLMSSLRGWWAKGDSRLIRTYALALGVSGRYEPAAINLRRLQELRKRGHTSRAVAMGPEYKWFDADSGPRPSSSGSDIS